MHRVDETGAVQAAVPGERHRQVQCRLQYRVSDSDRCNAGNRAQHQMGDIHMRIFVTGVNGQLGHDVINELVRRGHEGVGSGTTTAYSGMQDGTAVCTAPYVQLDIADSSAVERVLCSISATGNTDSMNGAGQPDGPEHNAAGRETMAGQPDSPERNAAGREAAAGHLDAVINCASWTAVDAAEDEANRDRVHQVNGLGPLYLAKACRQLDIPMMQISTDYVFDGQGDEPFRTGFTDAQPLNYYGITKREGELAVASVLDRYYIVRTSWSFGRNGHNFVQTMLNIGRTHERISVVDDQTGTPTYTYDLARLLVDMIENEDPARYGYYHATNEGGYITWYEFAREIFRQAAELGHARYAADRLSVVPIQSSEYAAGRAARPHNSRLDKSSLALNGFTPLPDWKDALGRYLKEIEI